MRGVADGRGFCGWSGLRLSSVRTRRRPRPTGVVKGLELDVGRRSFRLGWPLLRQLLVLVVGAVAWLVSLCRRHGLRCCRRVVAATFAVSVA
ncbi:hypothetical protein M407DRAFT_119925 [Tulasnella calospora MUT 4182]|uniref:Uncharacterized protein n=1 Tax=Tulasnella calospora MUT 4182 TaxID=1051891 RepID=A0A0C3LLE8_9AGAM|nr:hypothetical protein M407DRAFT_119925 [Tulasnella calospora MUT 4182]